jgi:hypothetical protein
MQAVHLAAPDDGLGAIAAVEIVSAHPNSLGGRLAAPAEARRERVVA